jgi:transcriptional regulator with XRE-family HTH domain
METRLREFRQRKGLTGEQFARIIGIDPATLSNIENPNSKRNPPITNKIINAVYEKFGVRYEELFPYEPKTYTPFAYKNAELTKIIESAAAFEKKFDTLVSLYPFLSEPVKALKSAVDAVGEIKKKIAITVLGQDGSGKSRLINNLCGKALLPESWDNPNVCTVYVCGGPAPNPKYKYYIFKNKLPQEKGADVISGSIPTKDVEDFDVEKVSDTKYFERFIESYGGIDIFSAYVLKNGSRQNGAEYTAVVYDDAEIFSFADIAEIPAVEANRSEATNKSLLAESICIYCSKASEFLNMNDNALFNAAQITYRLPVHLFLYASGCDLLDDEVNAVDERIQHRYSSFTMRAQIKYGFNIDEWNIPVSIVNSLDINEKLEHVLDGCTSQLQKNYDLRRELYIQLLTYMNKFTLDTNSTKPSQSDSEKIACLTGNNGTFFTFHFAGNHVKIPRYAQLYKKSLTDIKDSKNNRIPTEELTQLLDMLIKHS